MRLRTPGQAAADEVRDLIRSGAVRALLLQEHLNPATGRPAGRDPRKRQILRLLPGAAGAESRIDPVTGQWLVRVRWQVEDQLTRDYCFKETPVSGGPPVDDLCLFHGNLVTAYHGRPASVLTFKDPDAIVSGALERHYEPTARWGTLCRLPEDQPLAYRAEARRSTLEIDVFPSGGGPAERWEEHDSLVHSLDTDSHFLVETDELERSVIRFGNGVNGRALPERAVVRCRYQIGRGLDGNIGADRLVRFAEASPSTGAVVGCWNPFDATDGRAPEPAAEIVRNAPEAFRYRQERAITLRDYVRRTEELPGVSRAAASYAWTGSWRTVRITVDPTGSEELSDELRDRVAGHLEALRLIGEDLEIRPPQFVPLRIELAVCLSPDVWPEDVRFVIDQELSTGYTPDGRQGFFHPDRWTFGQPLHASELEGRVQAVPGVEHVISVSLRRWDAATPGARDPLEVGPHEIIRVHNDPDHMELGSIEIDLQGGRR